MNRDTLQDESGAKDAFRRKRGGVIVAGSENGEDDGRVRWNEDRR